MTTKGDLSALHNERQQLISERYNVADELRRLHEQHINRLQEIDQRIDQIEHQIEHTRATSMWQQIKTMIFQR